MKKHPFHRFTTWLLLGLPLLLLPVNDSAGATNSRESTPIRLLFAGSSSTYWNDLPQAVADLVSGKLPGQEGRPVSAELVGRSGSDIRVYLQPGFSNYQYGVKPGQTFLEKIAEERFDYVSLMVVCRFIMGDGGPENPDGIAHREAVTRYCQAIREAGGEPVFYEMGWGKSDTEAAGRKRILDLARQNQIRIFVPCSSAWARVYQERPDLRLQHPNDGSHPGDLGHFLNMACFYAAFTRQSPVGQLPRTYPVWPHFTKAEKEARQDELQQRFANFQPNPYQARLPEWMRKNASALPATRIDEETASYLESVAWKTWSQLDSQLSKVR